MTTIATILLSYNRPRMLREAIASLADAGPDQVVLIDDGSDFDPVPLVEAAFPDAWQFVLAPPMTLDERLITPRLGRLINQALGAVTCDVVTYLCDDDLFHPGWLSAVRQWFDAHPFDHWCRGTWYQFSDGEPPGRSICPLDIRQLTTGNFAHRAACYQQCGIRWDETTVACHDDRFLWIVNRHHNTFAVPDIGAVAGWRRLHAHNALRYTSHAVYHANARELFSGGWLE
jgi:glycosyltransferase involved in cell wall biosynthesis